MAGVKCTKFTDVITKGPKNPIISSKLLATMSG